MTLPLGYHDLMEALAERGCPVCRLVQHGVDRYLDGLLYEYVNTPPVHRDFRAGRGLCNTHMWQLPTYRGVSLGVSILEAAVLDEVLTLSEQHAPTENNSSGLGRLLRGRSTDNAALADALEPVGPCLACREAERVERRTLQTLAAHFASYAELFGQSDGLCLPHFRLLLRQPLRPQTASTVTQAQQAVWTRLKHELQEFQRKSDINHAGEAMGAEGDSWIRAIDSLTGARNALPDRTRTDTAVNTK